MPNPSIIYESEWSEPKPKITASQTTSHRLQSLHQESQMRRLLPRVSHASELIKIYWSMVLVIIYGWCYLSYGPSWMEEGSLACLRFGLEIKLQSLKPQATSYQSFIRRAKCGWWSYTAGVSCQMNQPEWKKCSWHIWGVGWRCKKL